MVVLAPESCVLISTFWHVMYAAWARSLGEAGFAVGARMLDALVFPHAFGFLAHGREREKEYVYSQCELCTARRGDA